MMNSGDWEILWMAVGVAIACAVRDGDRVMMANLLELFGKLVKLRDELKKRR